MNINKLLFIFALTFITKIFATNIYIPSINKISNINLGIHNVKIQNSNLKASTIYSIALGGKYRINYKGYFIYQYELNFGNFDAINDNVKIYSSEEEYTYTYKYNTNGYLGQSINLGYGYWLNRYSALTTIFKIGYVDFQHPIADDDEMTDGGYLGINLGYEFYYNSNFSINLNAELGTIFLDKEYTKYSAGLIFNLNF